MSQEGIESAALRLFNSLKDYSNLQALIDNGESEGLYLECKAIHEPRLTRESKIKLAEALSGFSNTEGGVYIWGIATTKHQHSNLDILTQITPIGNCRQFAKQVENAIPILTTPFITTSITKTIVKSPKDTQGVVLTYIPKTLGDPIRIIADNHFYIRTGDGFSIMPYQIIKKLFAATESPDLQPNFDNRLVKINDKGLWEVPFIIDNLTSAVAENVELFVEILDPLSCEEIVAKDFDDASSANPEKKIFNYSFKQVLHRGIRNISGTLRFRMKGKKRMLRLNIKIFANKMRAREHNLSIQLTRKGFSVKKTSWNYLY